MHFSVVKAIFDIPRIGIQRRSTILRLDSLSDCYLFTSLAENQPLTVLESLRAGNPVFVFATGGAADLMQEVSGLFLSPSLDTDQVINEIINFHSSDRLKKEILIPSEKYLSLSVHTNLILNLYRSTPS